MDAINAVLTSTWFILGCGVVGIVVISIYAIPGVRHERKIIEYTKKTYPIGAEVMVGDRKAVVVRHGHLHLGQVYVLPMDPGASEVLVEITALKAIQAPVAS